MQRLRDWKSSSPLIRRDPVVLLLAGVLLIGLASATSAAPATHLAEKGEALFQEKCAACHTIGKGRLVGPDLQGVGQRVSHEWLKRFVTAPSKMLANKDPTALKLFAEFNIPMPDPGLSEAEVDAVVSYLEQPTEAEHHAQVSSQPASVPPAQVGNPAVGKDLFAGSVRLQNGGPGCLACHTVEGVGFLGGGTLGPDLTQVYRRFGQAGLASALGTLPFPTMQGIFRGKPLTQTEQADLLAFFAEESQRNVTVAGLTWDFAGIGLGGFIVLAGASQLFWGKRLKGVRKRLLRGEK